MDFQTAIKTGFRKYASASGRASRAEFWYWTLFSTLMGVAGWLIDLALFGAHSSIQVFSPLVSLGLLAPDVAVSLRRLHDLDRSWPWLLIYLTGIGVIVLLVWFCIKGTAGPNRFGPDPLQADPAAPLTGSAAALT
jgi:uncharacterized membrane protein YhaH (DUF805 family)